MPRCRAGGGLGAQPRRCAGLDAWELHESGCGIAQLRRFADFDAMQLCQVGFIATQERRGLGARQLRQVSFDAGDLREAAFEVTLLLGMLRCPAAAVR